MKLLTYYKLRFSISNAVCLRYSIPFTLRGEVFLFFSNAVKEDTEVKSKTW
jgi:hypothetical protein